MIAYAFLYVAWKQQCFHLLLKKYAATDLNVTNTCLKKAVLLWYYDDISSFYLKVYFTR